jgi:2-dehydro-3-deoxy-D-arabinonate dehydratase
MNLYRTSRGHLLVDGNSFHVIDEDWDKLINRRGLHKELSAYQNSKGVDGETARNMIEALLPPIGSQEVWASGVTYLRSRDARMEEAKAAGGGDFYQKVYEADRPELFFKSLPTRVVGNNAQVNIRQDSTWNVPEPELTLFINSWGEIEGYTAGNDMSSRSIEGENPLYLPQAKSYEGSCALGPCLYVPASPISSETKIAINIARNSKSVFDASIQISKMKRTLPELAGWLFKGLRFANGCFLMTGTGLVPGNDFTLEGGDVVSISIENIGTLRNQVGVLKTA